LTLENVFGSYSKTVPVSLKPGETLVIPVCKCAQGTSEELSPVRNEAVPAYTGPMRANDYQVGGKHYQSEIQHWDYVLANEIPYLEAMIIKYLTRWRKKNGVEDVKKAYHFFLKLAETLELNLAEKTSDPGPQAGAEADRRYVYQGGPSQDSLGGSVAFSDTRNQKR
jgi:uncharacterized protein DUF3310